MGGVQPKSKFVCPRTGEMRHFFRLPPPYDWLCGGAVPAFHECMDRLVRERVGLVVTLLLEPLQNGRNINHMPAGAPNETQWVDGDGDLLDKVMLSSAPGTDIGFVHVPVAVGAPLTIPWTTALCDVVGQFRRIDSERGVFVHCWQGKDRTSVALATLLMHFTALTPEAAISVVQQANKRFDLNWYQREWIFHETAWTVAIDNPAFEPTIHTPREHPCYKIGQIPDRTREPDDDRFTRTALTSLRSPVMNM